MAVNGKKRIWLLIALLLAAACLALALCFRGDAAEEPSLSARIPNNEQVVAAIRTGLREHSRQITVRFSCRDDVSAQLNALVGEWMEAALQETDDPAEGDYIRYQYGGYTVTGRCEPVDGQYHCTAEIVPRYYTYLVEEQAVTERLEEILSDFDFDGDSTDLEKIETIYRYLCGSVRYDKVHRKHPTATKRSTAYSALIWHSATCQGYCTALYRMLRTAGVNTRIVTGTAAGEEFHAWNIVELDGLWYVLDATWDAGREDFGYFLRGTDGLDDHVPGPAFTTPAFRRAYPMAAADYTAER